MSLFGRLGVSVSVCHCVGAAVSRCFNVFVLVSGYLCLDVSMSWCRGVSSSFLFLPSCSFFFLPSCLFLLASSFPLHPSPCFLFPSPFFILFSPFLLLLSLCILLSRPCLLLPSPSSFFLRLCFLVLCLDKLNNDSTMIQTYSKMKQA